METDPLPEGVELLMTEEKRLGLVIRFMNKYWEKDHFHQIILSDYYDKEGKEYSFNSWGHGYFDDLAPAYSHVWKTNVPIVVEIK